MRRFIIRTPRGMMMGVQGREGIRQIIRWHRRGAVVIERIWYTVERNVHFAGIRWL